MADRALMQHLLFLLLALINSVNRVFVLQRTHALHTCTCISLTQQRINLKPTHRAYHKMVTKKSRACICVIYLFIFFLFFLHINYYFFFFPPSFFSSPILLEPFFLLTTPRTNSAGAWVILEYRVRGRAVQS